MPQLNTNPASAAQVNSYSSPRNPFPFSPDSYRLPRSITAPLDPDSPLLPTNSPTFLVSGSENRPPFKVPTSPVSEDTRDGINSYAEWVAGQDEEDDETEGLIIFPPYHISLPALRHAATSSFHRDDLEPELSSESFFDFSDDSSCSSSPSETESESELSSRSSSPSLEDKDFDCIFDLEEDWSRSSCATPTLSAPPFLFAEDDIALHVAAQPAHGVDFLAHEWKTDDFARNIRASKRLENALWRASIRNMRGLRRVDPEVIHWLKDSDTTWLYGPFKPASACSCTNMLGDPVTALTPPSPPAQNARSQPSPPKSLLKKRDAKDVLQQRSEYTLSLLREATGYPAWTDHDPQPNFRRGDIDALGLRRQEKKGPRVTFHETVILYREVVEAADPEPVVDDEQAYLRSLCKDFGGVD